MGLEEEKRICAADFLEEYRVEFEYFVTQNYEGDAKQITEEIITALKGE